MITVELKISGKVQGVFFRGATRLRAQALKITGLVRNENDGTVFITATGDMFNIEDFIQWCHKGPEGAKVTGVEINYLNSPKHFNTFEITY